MTKEEIEQAAREYSTGKSSSDVFREAHETDFIAGANWALQSENERLKAERDSNWISLERAKKYARHQHYLGTQGNELVEFEDWECKPPKQ